MGIKLKGNKTKKIVYFLCLAIGLLISQNNTFAQKQIKDLEFGIRIPQPEEILEIEREKNFKVYPLMSIPLASPPYKISILKGGSYCALTDRDKNFIIYELQEKKIVFSEKFFYELYGLTTHPHRNNIVCFGDKIGRITIFDAEGLEKIHTIMEQKNPIADVKFSPDGTVLGVAHFGGTVSFYDTEKWSLLQEAKIHENSIYAIDFSSDSSFFASASRDKTVRVTKLGESSPFVILKKPLHLVLCVRFSAQENFLSAGSADGNLYVWSMAGEKFDPYFEWTHGDWITALDSFNNYLFTGCKDGKVRIFNYKDKTLTGIFEAGKTSIMDIEVYPALNYLLLATKEDLLIYDLKDVCK